MKPEHQTYDSIMGLGRFVTAFGMKTAEQEEKFKLIAEVIAEISPQGKSLLEQKRLSIEKMSRDKEVAFAQVKRLAAFITGAGHADIIPDLPRPQDRRYDIYRSY